MSITREQVITTARSYKGVRFQHQGRTPLGLDCVGLLIIVAHNVGYTDYDFTTYDRVPDGKLFWQAMCRHLHSVDGLDEVRPGDVLLMKYHLFPQHVAFVSEVLPEGRGWKIIHAFNHRGVIEHDLDERWLESNRAKIYGAFSLFAPEPV